MSRVTLRDPAMPALTEALEPSQMQMRLSNVLTGGETVRAVDVLKYKPGRRCALAYTLEGPEGLRRVFAKLFATGRGAGIFMTQQRIFEALDPRVLRVPRPLAYLPELKLLITEYLEGSLLAEELYRGDTESAATRMGEALAAFHQSGIVCAKRWTLERELSNAVRTCEESLADPSRARALAARIEDGAKTVSAGPEVPVHRDYYLDQLLNMRGQTVLFDLDDVRQGDAALDVGNFVAHLTLRPLQFPEVSAACEATRAPFLAAYRRGAGSDESFQRRARLYEATSLLRLAGVYAGRPRWASSTPDGLFAACQRVLDTTEDS